MDISGQGTRLAPDALPDEKTVAPTGVAIADIGEREGTAQVFRVELARPSAVSVVLDMQITCSSASAGTEFELTDFRYSEDDGVTWKDACGDDGTEVAFAPGNTAILVETLTREADLFAGDEAFSLTVKGVVSGLPRHIVGNAPRKQCGNAGQAGTAIPCVPTDGPGVTRSAFFFSTDGDNDLAPGRSGPHPQ